MRIRILPEAERDLEIGADFYEAQREGLGRYLSDCLMSDIESLRLYAGIHERQHGLHRSMSKRFPFAVFYDVTKDTISVYAVLDCRQNPATIQKRLEWFRPEHGGSVDRS
ncbi:MAG: type II toxin-antitoxin system RelE/ParE family toxin [Thermoguttaceae bacterium]|jgi:plasmid stabilization system protein ParE|nr:type II toxin-antitoxin system RelE/ParE family toxin [Thermoguttaceae bacterium]